MKIYTLIITEDIEIKSIQSFHSKQAADAAFDKLLDDASISEWDPNDLTFEVDGTRRAAGDDSRFFQIVHHRIN